MCERERKNVLTKDLTKRIKKQANNLLAHRNKVRSKGKKKELIILTWTLFLLVSIPLARSSSVFWGRINAVS